MPILPRQGTVRIISHRFGTGRCVDDLVDSIKHEGFKPEDISHILMTHHHQDHTGGAKELRERFGCEVWICDDPGKHLLEQGTMDDLGYTFGIEKGLIPEDLPFRHCPVAHGIADGEEFAIGGVSITAIKTIGHSPDSMCFEMELDGLNCLFCGDTVLFGGVVGMINYPWSSLEDFHTGSSKAAWTRHRCSVSGTWIFLPQERPDIDR